MITLYHGSLEVIEAPEIRIPNRTLDFGAGFYLTSSEAQAEQWIKRRIDAEHPSGFINRYEFDDSVAEKELNLLRFESPTDQWLDFVMANRQIPDFIHDYDIFIGPVANDKVYTAFALYEGGTISKNILIQELKTYRLVDQYLFHTNNALKLLKFQSATKVTK